MSRPDTIVVAEPRIGGRLRPHLRMIVQLGAPVTVSRLLGLMLFVIDSAMIGHVSSQDLAYFGLGHAIHFVLLLVGIGMLIGTAVLTAQAHGADSLDECGVIWRVACVHGFVLGGLSVLAGLAGEPFYHAIGQAPGLASGGGHMLILLTLGLPGQLVYIASTLFLEALGRPRPGLFVMLGGNVANIGLNLWLIYGGLGLPALGADGAVLATAVVRWGIAVALVLYVLRLPDASALNVAGAFTGALEISRKLRRIGYPLGLAQGLESSAFSALTMFAGYLGVTAVAGYQVSMNVIAFCFMGVVGIGTATAVRVGQAVGRRAPQEVALAGWSGLIIVLIYMAVLAIGVAAAPALLGRIFTDDTAVLAIVVPTLLVSAATMLPDGAQGVLMGALRGAGDVWIPTAMHLFSFMAVMVPAAAAFALHFGLGPPGLMLGALCGVTVATALLASRFHIVSRRDIKRL